MFSNTASTPSLGYTYFLDPCAIQVGQKGPSYFLYEQACYATDGEHTSKKAKVAVAAKQPKAIVLDIEGTVAPISFVTETLFPYARQRVREHLSSTYDSEETQADIALLRDQVHPCAVFRSSLFQMLLCMLVEK